MMISIIASDTDNLETMSEACLEHTVQKVLGIQVMHKYLQEVLCVIKKARVVVIDSALGNRCDYYAGYAHAQSCFVVLYGGSVDNLSYETQNSVLGAVSSPEHLRELVSRLAPACNPHAHATDGEVTDALVSATTFLREVQ